MLAHKRYHRAQAVREAEASDRARAHMDGGIARVFSSTNATRLCSLAPELHQSGHPDAQPFHVVVSASDVGLVWETPTAAPCGGRVTTAATRVGAGIGAVSAVLHDVGGALERVDGADLASTFCPKVTQGRRYTRKTCFRTLQSGPCALPRPEWRRAPPPSRPAPSRGRISTPRDRV
jgi:hypothetical protein